MTTRVIDYERRLEKIESTGYWRVIIHPSVFDEQRIKTLDECWRIMKTSSVNFRGIPYPPVRDEEFVRGNDWVQSGGEFGDGIEVWRFFQSGQFVHTFSVNEDITNIWSENGAETEEHDSSRRELNIFNALFTITEILEFSRNLAHRNVLEPEAVVQIELHGMKGRHLVSPHQPLRRRFGSYVSQDDMISWSTRLLPVQLIAAAPERALDATLRIFERFNWHDPPRSLLAQAQRRLLEGRPY